jgi:hypothetical protein
MWNRRVNKLLFSEFVIITHNTIDVVSGFPEGRHIVAVFCHGRFSGVIGGKGET